MKKSYIKIHFAKMLLYITVWNQFYIPFYYLRKYSLNKNLVFFEVPRWWFSLMLLCTSRKDESLSIRLQIWSWNILREVFSLLTLMLLGQCLDLVHLICVYFYQINSKDIAFGKTNLLTHSWEKIFISKLLYFLSPNVLIFLILMKFTIPLTI